MRVLLVSLLLVAGCAGQLTAPNTFLEQVAYAEAGRQGALQTINDLTCYRGYRPNGTCLEPGKPLHPAKAIELTERLADVRRALQTAVRLPESGGECLRASRTPQACLQAAQALLLEVEAYLAERQ